MTIQTIFKTLAATALAASAWVCAEAQETGWSVDAHAWRYDMSVYASLTARGERVDPATVQVGVFCGGECRGVAETLALGDAGDCLYIRVRSNEPEGETMEFRYRDLATDEVRSLEGVSFTFAADSMLGLPSTPFAADWTTWHDITLATAGHGTVAGEPGRYKWGTELTFLATPDEGYSFAGWSDGNSDNPRTLTVSEDTELAPVFSVNTYRLTVYVDGEETESREIPYGDPVSVSDPVPGEGMVFDGWQEEIPETMPAHDVAIHGTTSPDAAVGEIVADGDGTVTVTTLGGVRLMKGAERTEALRNLPKGIYIINGRRVMVP